MRATDTDVRIHSFGGLLKVGRGFVLHVRLQMGAGTMESHMELQ
jgi:hypothetical protein